MAYLIVVLSLIILVIGAELLVAGAAKLATHFKVSPWLVGIVIVGFGTSLPELTVSMLASLEGKPGAAVGNVVGSNIFNAWFILGMAALVSPLLMDKRSAALDLPFLIVSSLWLLYMVNDLTIEPWEGLCSLVWMAIYLLLVFRSSSSDSTIEQGQQAENSQTLKTVSAPLGRALLKYSISILVGLVLLVIASSQFVNAAVQIARDWGVSDLIIGLTVLAGGTSLPELVTSVTASLRRQGTIAVANVVGSNIFNVLVVLGLSALMAENGLAIAPNLQQLDTPLLLFIAVLFVPLYLKGRIGRWLAVMFLMAYVAYTVLLIHLTHTELPMLVFIFGPCMVVLSMIGLTYWFYKQRSFDRQKMECH